MTLKTRLDEITKALSPKELILTWMREAHEYGSYLSYGLSLLDQPEDAYPLVRLPQLLYAGTKTRLRGRQEEDRQRPLRSGYRDLLFLFHLHSQLNERVAHRLKELTFRVFFLTEQLRRFMDRDSLLEDQTELLKLIPGKKPRLPRRDKVREREKLELWREHAGSFEADVRDLLGAAKRLSARYYAGEDVLFPDARAALVQALEIHFHNHRLDLLCYGTKAECRRVAATMEETFELGSLTDHGQDLAVELVTLAKAEALSALGKHTAGVRLVEEWMRASGYAEMAGG
jgi:hypothetical protein